jgi:hypothetical protein
MTAGTGFFTLNAKFPQTLPLGESRSSRVPSCPSRVPTSFGTRKPLQLQAFILTEPVNFAIFKKTLRHTCVTGKKSAFFSRFPRSIFKDQTPDRRPPSERRLPACNEREARTSFLRKPARSKGETLKSGLCRPLRSSRLRALLVFFVVPAFF